MAGGSGNGFWPITRESFPQFLLRPRPNQEGSFLRSTFLRFAEFVPKENIFVVTLSRFALLVRKELPELPQENLLEEPFGRKTAPCIAYAACKVRERDPEAIMIATPADHIISEGPLFAETLLSAAEYVDQEDILMTLGIHPTGPKTDYGYIQIQGGPEARHSGTAMPVKTFTEKPDASLAEVFFQSGEFFWNSGIFLWRNETIISEIRKHVPYLVPLLDGWGAVAGTEKEEAFLARCYADCEKESIDYAVMEKTDRAWLYPVRFGWADLGSWDALYDSFSYLKDEEGNVSNARVYGQDASGNIALSHRGDKLFAVKGLSDYMLIDSPDVLLVCPRDDQQYRDFMAGLTLLGQDKYR